MLVTFCSFSLRQKTKDENGEFETREVTVHDYFVNTRGVELRYSSDLPCVNVGKPKKPIFLPIEVEQWGLKSVRDSWFVLNEFVLIMLFGYLQHCSLVSLQRYTKSLNTMQRASLVEKSRQKPQERMRVLTDALKINNYDAEPLLKSCGISISNSFTQVEGRVLQAPKLKVGNGEDFFPRNGRWNFNNKKLVDPTKIEKWAVANFSARCDIPNLVRDLIKCGGLKGIKINEPFDVFQESPQDRRAPPLVRVEKMFDSIQSKLPGAPQFLLCLLPERKNSDLYGPWKKKNLAEYGIVTQCIAPMRVNDQYLTNVLLKINAKLGGLNSMLAVEFTPSIPMVSKCPTIILGMDVSHGQAGQSDVPSIAAVVSSRQWPSISRYRASVRTQSPKVEMIDNLFKKVSDTEDEGIVK
ncbi:argonaute 4-like protein [Tanacetum coccineum]